jgi:ATP-binding cassette subfamily B protein
MKAAPDRRQLAPHAWSAARLASQAAPTWLAALLMVTVTTAVAPVATVTLLKVVLDALVRHRPAQATAAGAGLVTAGVAVAALPSVSQYLRAQIGRLTGRRAQSDLYHAISRCAGLARQEDPSFRDRLRMAQGSGRSVPGQVVDSVVGLGQGAITLVGLIGVLASISPLMAMVAVLGTAPALVAQLQLSRARARMLWRISPVERREFFYVELQTSLAAAKELRLLGLSELFRQRMLTELAAADTHRSLMDRRELRVQFGLGLLAALLSGGGLVWAVSAASDGKLGVGDVSAFVAGMAGLQAGLAAVVGSLTHLHHALVLYEHYLAVLKAEPDLLEPDDPLPVPQLARGIELRDVWFRYSPDQDWVLRGVSLVIPRGQAIALVGLNGAGKSTLVKLLCRFYDPQRGQILWDGADLRELSINQLRERIGAVFQDYMDYDLTASENIGLGDVSALTDETRIRAAARRAGVDEALDALPRGYQTMLSRMFAGPPTDEDPEAGVLLSGGQWQRVALARAFMRDRRDLLILDEPSSGLDAEAEYKIHHGLKRYRAGATSVLISHRLGAVRDADQIVVLAQGRIAQHGRHDELLAAGGEYARLFRMQAEPYQNDPPVEGVLR